MRNNEQRIEKKALTDHIRSLLAQNLVDRNAEQSDPNVYRTLAQSPETLSAFLHFESSLANSKISKVVRLKLALLVSELNNSEYDVAALTYAALQEGIEPDEIELNRLGSSNRSNFKAILQFAQKVVQRSGILKDEDLHSVRQYLKDDGQIIDILAQISATSFTNLINNLANTELDFPVIKQISHSENLTKTAQHHVFK